PAAWTLEAHRAAIAFSRDDESRGDGAQMSQGFAVDGQVIVTRTDASGDCALHHARSGEHEQHGDGQQSPAKQRDEGAAEPGVPGRAARTKSDEGGGDCRHQYEVERPEPDDGDALEWRL